MARHFKRTFKKENFDLFKKFIDKKKHQEKEMKIVSNVSEYFEGQIVN